MNDIQCCKNTEFYFSYGKTLLYLGLSMLVSFYLYVKITYEVCELISWFICPSWLYYGSKYVLDFTFKKVF